MTREQLENYIRETYNADAEHPWEPDSDHTVFRHRTNRKWFAVIMEIPEAKLGLSGQERICIVNLKCDPMMVGSLLCEDGIYPAYHMNKTHWISVVVDNGANEDRIGLLLDISFELTERKVRNAGKKRGADD